ncbi:24401_t:CDS:2 [Gigaspora rosea]|nr:24401_t:CDS:2 [Gigaspora rosea]
MMIWTSRNWEKNVQQLEHIKFYTNRRYSDFRDNMILPDNVITNQKEIKEAIRNHFSKWSKENPLNWDYQEE